ncbi:MAG: hypothetical protein V3V14_13100 [Saprospiraceae bacterium]
MLVIINPLIVQAQDECGMSNSDQNDIAITFTGCDNHEKYFQNAPLPFHSVTAKEVNLFIHIIRDGNGLQNYQNSPTDIAKLNKIVADMNTKLQNMEPQTLLMSVHLQVFILVMQK